MDNLLILLFLSLRVLMAALLYLFLGWAILVMLRSLKQQGLNITIHDISAITLKFADEQFTDKTFEKPQFYIGRSPASECFIDHKTVSSQHAVFSYHHNQWWIKDAGSKNGTYVNEQIVSEA
ncbi:MAG: FHA domain-containing protein, partial [Chloroflexi bacterium]|nr:FHA domain-containing protein [Chloroflexota bacterium]